MQDDLFDASLIEQAPDCISGYDAALNITIWNSACEKKFGLSKEQALGKPLLTLFPEIEKDHRLQCLQKAAQEGASFFFSNLPYLFEDGFYTQAIIPLHDKNRQVFRVLNIVRDMTTVSEARIKKEDLLASILKSRIRSVSPL
jgi:PAS domain S-box-containing protein